jgi:hypothetical protein
LKIDFRFSLSPMKAAECTGPNSDLLVVGFILKDELNFQQTTKQSPIKICQQDNQNYFLMKTYVIVPKIGTLTRLKTKAHTRALV